MVVRGSKIDNTRALEFMWILRFCWERLWNHLQCGFAFRIQVVECFKFWSFSSFEFLTFQLSHVVKLYSCAMFDLSIAESHISRYVWQIQACSSAAIVAAGCFCSCFLQPVTVVLPRLQISSSPILFPNKRWSQWLWYIAVLPLSSLVLSASLTTSMNVSSSGQGIGRPSLVESTNTFSVF